MKTFSTVYGKRSPGAIVLALVCFCATAGSGANNPSFSLSVRAREPRVLALHEVLLDVTVTNTSSHILTITAFPPEEIYTVELTAPDGQRVPPTELGSAIIKNGMEMVKQSRSPLDMRGFLSVTLLPRQTCNEVLRISHMYGIATPGIYSVRLHRKIPEDPDAGEAVSNLISFTVEYNPAVEKYAPVGRKEP